MDRLWRVKDGRITEVEDTYCGSRFVRKDRMRLDLGGTFYATHAEAVRASYDILRRVIPDLKAKLSRAEEARDAILAEHSALLVAAATTPPEARDE